MTGVATVVTKIKELVVTDNLNYFQNVTICDTVFNFHILFPFKDNTYKSLFVIIIPMDFPSREIDSLLRRMIDRRFYILVWRAGPLETGKLVPNYYGMMKEKINTIQHSNADTNYYMQC